MAEGIVVSVQYKLKPGMEIIGRQDLEELAVLNRKAEGCKKVTLHRDLKDPAHFLSISHWDGMDKFMALLGEPHIKDYAEKSKKRLQHPFEVTIWEALD